LTSAGCCRGPQSWEPRDVVGGRRRRLATRRDRTPDEYVVALRALFALDGFDSSQLQAAVVASVVPTATEAIGAGLDHLVEGRVVTLGQGVDYGLRFTYPNPKEVGADRVANAVAALAEYGAPVVVVDFGTATTFDVVDGDGAYVGGVIAPGLQVSMESLVQATAALRRVPLQPPPSVIGGSTVEAMQSGLLYGYAGLVDGLIGRVVDELEGNPALVATGGLASTVVPHCQRITTIDEFLTLKGLRLIYHRNP